MRLTPFFLASAVKRLLTEIVRNGYDFDLIDAHYFYPDGVAATVLGKYFDKPVVITARGTDINLIPKYYLPRKTIQWAARRASSIITVCKALKDTLIDMHVPEGKITVLRNGVDLHLFHPLERETERSRLGLTTTTLLSVGNLIKRKGNDIVIKALANLPEVELLIVGEGKEKKALKSLAHSMGVADRVRFLGAIRQEELKQYYSAADALILASSREGWANVLLEAMACGTPVIATKVWGTPEVVKSPDAGILMEERTPDALVKAFHKLFSNYPQREATRRYAERFSWDDTTRAQILIYESILNSTPRGSQSPHCLPGKSA
jgi:glycosyltransferase involved in cell wall biosynthesis